jgi:16S rRNA C967 or C1407 C5-methylase (RsmB/RsmF family)/NOL1/NOP2/fmu family ribosome biogenesis protein
MSVLPASFTARMQQQLGDQFAAFEQSLQSPSPTSIRINSSKVKSIDSLEAVLWAQNAYYLPQRPLFTADPLLHAGAYYVQEASSMCLELAINQWIDSNKALLALDLCAAPGGKSTHLHSLLSPDSCLVSNEVIKSRSHILQENLSKWGHTNSVVTQSDASRFKGLPSFFDLIVVDAPCSGEGLFRKDEEAIKEWSEDNCKLCEGRQMRILEDILPALKDGGTIVYSTCTYNPLENELLVEKFAKGNNLEILQLASPDIHQLTPKEAGGKIVGYQCYPHKIKGEGFFFAGLRKKGTDESNSYGKVKQNWISNASKKATEGLPRLFDGDDLAYFTIGNELTAFPQYWEDALFQLAAQVKVLQAGCPVGSVIHGKFNPAAELALSSRFLHKNFPSLELDLENTLAFLSRQDFDHSEAENGWNLISYQHIPLGWIKKIGNRANNYWPTNWRIRMGMDELLEASINNPLPKLQTILS